MRINQPKKLLITMLIIVVGLSAAWWVAGHTRLHVTSANSAIQRVEYTLVDPMGSRTKGASVLPFSKIIGKGEHQLYFTSGTQTSMQFFSAPGFMRKVSLNHSFSPEASRTFVGVNPGPCMVYSGGVFMSGACGATEGLEKQIVATPESPAYTVPSGITGFSRAIDAVQYAGGRTITISHLRLDDGYEYQLTSYSSDLTQDAPVSLGVFATLQSFIMSPYGEGVLIHASDLSLFRYYDPSSNAIAPATEPVLNKRGSNFINLTSTKDSYIASYSSAPSDSIDNTNDPIPSDIVLVRGNQRSTHTLPETHQEVANCGEDVLCATDASGVTIYAMSSDSIKKLYTIPGFTSLFDTEEGIRFVGPEGILAFDTKTRSGHLEYSFSNYTSCGYQLVEGGYLLCLVNKHKDKVAIFVDQTQSATNTLDKDVESLFDNKEINNISITGDIVYISPNYGGEERTFIPPNNATRERIDQSLTRFVNAWKKDHPRYTVVQIGATR